MNVPPIGAVTAGPDVAAAGGARETGFGQAVMRQLDQVNARQQVAESLTQAYASGQDVDLHRVVLATQEAQLGLDLVLQVRNKLIDAYQEMMRMPM